MKTFVYLPALALLLFSPPSLGETVCELVAPLADSPAPNYGLIMVPGADIPGENYKPLAEVIQSFFPGSLWLGITEEWKSDYPNPMEIGEAINQCLAAAGDTGYDVDRTFITGHSLGGIVLGWYVENHADLTAGIILYGSYLDDDGEEPYTYPVPVLTAMGTLDGNGVPHIKPENDQAIIANEVNPGGEVVWAIDRVNHAQVASGEIPDIVIVQDIPPEISNEEAHERYAVASVAWMVNTYSGDFDQDVVDEWQQTFDAQQEFTDAFLAPFNEMALLELDADGASTPWMLDGQRVLLNLNSAEEDAADLALTVTTELVSKDELGATKPEVDQAGCSATVSTYSTLERKVEPYITLQSTSVIKAKFKLEDSVNEALCFPPREQLQCKDINQAAFDLALAAADDVSRDRYLSQGRQLVMVDDDVATTGPGWEFSTGLHYTEVDDLTVELQSVALVAEDDIAIPLIAGMHYCDLLSPYRALEWIYDASVVHG